MMVNTRRVGVPIPIKKPYQNQSAPPRILKKKRSVSPLPAPALMDAYLAPYIAKKKREDAQRSRSTQNSDQCPPVTKQSRKVISYTPVHKKRIKSKSPEKPKLLKKPKPYQNPPYQPYTPCPAQVHLACKESKSGLSPLRDIAQLKESILNTVPAPNKELPPIPVPVLYPDLLTPVPYAVPCPPLVKAPSSIILTKKRLLKKKTMLINKHDPENTRPMVNSTRAVDVDELAKAVCDEATETCSYTSSEAIRDEYLNNTIKGIYTFLG